MLQSQNPMELGPGMHHRSAQASPGRGYLGPRAAGPSNARDNPVAWGPGWVPGPRRPRGRPHGRPVAARPAMRVACAAPVAPLVLAADGERPKIVGVHGHTSGRRQHRAATEEPIITIIFQNRCWVSGPGVEFTGKGGEEPLSGEEGRGPPPSKAPSTILVP